MATIPTKVRIFVAQRAKYCCEYCLAQEKYSPDYFSIEHIIPSIKGGSGSQENLAYACLACNNHKYTFTEEIDPVTGVSADLYNPRTDNWSDHFRWSNDLLYITGLTPKGRATIERLKINRASLVNLREILIPLGKHPPD